MPPSLFLPALALILKYLAECRGMEEVCLASSLRQVVAGIAEARACRKAVVTARDNYVGPIFHA